MSSLLWYISYVIVIMSLLLWYISYVIVIFFVCLFIWTIISEKVSIREMRKWLSPLSFSKVFYHLIVIVFVIVAWDLFFLLPWLLLLWLKWFNHLIYHTLVRVRVMNGKIFFFNYQCNLTLLVRDENISSFTTLAKTTIYRH